MSAVAIVALGIVACGRDAGAPAPASQPGPEGLAQTLATSVRAIAAADHPDALAAAIVGTWRMPEAAWGAQVTDAYRPHWRDYAAAFDAGTPAVAARLVALARRAPVRARWQYADDPSLSNAQIRVRWVMPVGRPGVVATIGGDSLDVVFVWDGAGWRALIGADDVIQAAVRAGAPSCLPALVAAGPAGRCTSIAWMIADAAMRGQGERLHKACAIAASNQCGAPP